MTRNHIDYLFKNMPGLLEQKDISYRTTNYRYVLYTHFIIKEGRTDWGSFCHASKHTKIAYP